MILFEICSFYISLQVSYALPIPRYASNLNELQYIQLPRKSKTIKPYKSIYVRGTSQRNPRKFFQLFLKIPLQKLLPQKTSKVSLSKTLNDRMNSKKAKKGGISGVLNSARLFPPKRKLRAAVGSVGTLRNALRRSRKLLGESHFTEAELEDRSSTVERYYFQIERGSTRYLAKRALFQSRRVQTFILFWEERERVAAPHACCRVCRLRSCLLNAALRVPLPSLSFFFEQKRLRTCLLTRATRVRPGSLDVPSFDNEVHQDPDASVAVPVPPHWCYLPATL